MGFLKFLNRNRKKEEMHDLDLPPAPPSMEGFDEGHDMLPEFDDSKINAEKMGDSKLPKDSDFDFSKDMDFGGNIDKGSSFPAIPDIEDHPSMPPQPGKYFPAMPEPQMQDPEEAEDQQQDTEKMPVRQEYHKSPKKYLFPERRAVSKRQIFVRAENFKSVLNSISSVRGSLRKSEEALIKLDNLKSEKDKSYDRFKSSLDDLQKKLIFIDKTLFQGD